MQIIKYPETKELQKRNNFEELFLPYVSTDVGAALKECKYSITTVSALDIFPLNFRSPSAMASVKHDYKHFFDALLYGGYIKPFLFSIRSRRDHSVLDTNIVETKRWWKQSDPFKFLFNIFMTYIALGFKEIQRVKNFIIIQKT